MRLKTLNFLCSSAKPKAPSASIQVQKSNLKLRSYTTSDTKPRHQDALHPLPPRHCQNRHPFARSPTIQNYPPRRTAKVSIHSYPSLYLNPNLTPPSPHRTLLTRHPLRPSLNILPRFSPPATTTSSSLPFPTPTTASTTQIDLLPKISTHPSLAGIQVRNGPRNTYDPSHLVRKRRHGFLARKKSRTGRAILVRRRAKRRGTLSH